MPGSHTDQYAAELTGPGSLTDKEIGRLRTKTGQSGSLRDLYSKATEFPRLIDGRYTAVGGGGNLGYGNNPYGNTSYGD